MIPALIFWLIRKFIRPKGPNWPILKRISRLRLFRSRAVTLWLLLVVCTPALSQSQSLFYNVMYHGDRVGQMTMIQDRVGEELRISVSSNTSMRMLLNINVDAVEESCFKDGKLVYSSVVRKVNGKEKANRQTEYQGDRYQLRTDGDVNAGTTQPILYNVHLLLCNEPHDSQAVYSDNFQQFLQVERVSDHKYRLTLPDGNYNLYYFNHGICEKIQINHTFYTVNLILDKSSTASK